MLYVLDVIRKQDQERRESTTRRKSCQGSTVKGHYRTYGEQRVWIESFGRDAHTRTYRKI